MHKTFQTSEILAVDIYVMTQAHLTLSVVATWY